jgi:hypothetical protein
MKKNDILIILIPLSVFVLAWIGFSIYHNIVTSTISEPLSIQIAPIVPTFDTNTIGKLKTRNTVSPIYELSTTTQDTVAIIASPSATPIMLNPIVSSTSATQATAEGKLLQ